MSDCDCCKMPIPIDSWCECEGATERAREMARRLKLQEIEDRNMNDKEDEIDYNVLRCTAHEIIIRLFKSNQKSHLRLLEAHAKTSLKELEKLKKEVKQ